MQLNTKRGNYCSFSKRFSKAIEHFQSLITVLFCIFLLCTESRVAKIASYSPQVKAGYFKLDCIRYSGK